MQAPYPSMSQRLDRIPVIGSLLGDSLAFWAGLADAANLSGMRYVLSADAARTVQTRAPAVELWPAEVEEDEARAA